MGFHYKIYDNDTPYFITTTVVDWVDIFTREEHKLSILESLRYCQKNKGLEIYAWCLMPDHLHMIAKAKTGTKLSDIIRDFKRHTSKKIVDAILEGNDHKKEQILKSFKFAASKYSNVVRYKIWKDGYHPIELSSGPFIYQKLYYIHNNPVKANLIQDPIEYEYSSARNYANMDGLLEIINILEYKFGRLKSATR